MGCGLVRSIDSVNAADSAGQSLPHVIRQGNRPKTRSTPDRDEVATALGVLLNCAPPCVPPQPPGTGGEFGSMYFSPASTPRGVSSFDCLPPFSRQPPESASVDNLELSERNFEASSGGAVRMAPLSDSPLIGGSDLFDDEGMLSAESHDASSPATRTRLRLESQSSTAALPSPADTSTASETGGLERSVCRSEADSSGRGSRPEPVLL